MILGKTINNIIVVMLLTSAKMESLNDNENFKKYMITKGVI